MRVELALIDLAIGRRYSPGKYLAALHASRSRNIAARLDWGNSGRAAQPNGR